MNSKTQKFKSAIYIMKDTERLDKIHNEYNLLKTKEDKRYRTRLKIFMFVITLN